MHAKIENGQVVEYPIINLRQKFPEVSLPVDLTNDAILPDGFVYVVPSTVPEHNVEMEKLILVSPVYIEPVTEPNPDYDPNAEGEEPAPEFLIVTPGRWVTSYDVVPLSEDELAQRQVQELHQAKIARYDEVQVIVVTTASGKQFDGNEEAQNRIGRAVAAMDEEDVLPWVLADNSVVNVSRTELREALKLAAAAMAAIWVRPYV